MFNAGLMGYNVARGLLGALKPRAPHAGLVDDLLAERDPRACLSRLQELPFLEGLDVADAEDPEQVERALRLACAEFARKIRKVIGGPAGRFLETYTLHYDFHNARVLFRAAVSGSAGGVGRKLYPLSDLYAGEAPERLSSAREAVEFFTGTALERPLRDALEYYESRSYDLSIFEVVAARGYVEMVSRAGGRLIPADGVRLRERLLEPWLGATGVLWILWLKAYRSMAAEEIVNVLDLPGEVLPGRVCSRLAGGEAPSAVAGDVSNTRLREFLSGGEVDGDPAGLHRAVRRFVWRTVTAGRLQVNFDISTLLSAVMRWEMIVEDAITVMTARAEGLESGRIEELLATRAA